MNILNLLLQRTCTVLHVVLCEMEQRPTRMLHFGCYACLTLEVIQSGTLHTLVVQFVTKPPSLSRPRLFVLPPPLPKCTLRLSETPTCGRRSTSSWQQALSKLLEGASRCLTSCPILFQSTAWCATISTACLSTPSFPLFRGGHLDECSCELELVSIRGS